MTGFDFFMYCLGLSTLLAACAGSVALLRASSRRTSARTAQADRPDPAADGLISRLLEAQATQYAAPIVRRELPDHVGPRFHRRVTPPPPVTGVSKKG